MNNTKKWLILASALFISGLVCCYISFAILGFDLDQLDNATYVTNTYEIKDDFKDIDIKADNELIFIKLSSDNNCKVICKEKENKVHNVLVSDNTLEISESLNQINDWSFIFTGQKESITIYLPESEFNNLNIDSDTGNINIDKDFLFNEINIDADTASVDLSASVNNKLSIKTDTGRINLKDLKCGETNLKSSTGHIEISDVDIDDDLNIKQNTGKIVLNNAFVKKDIDIQSDTGAVELNVVDGANLKIKTSTGNVSGVLASPKIFEAHSSTGKINVPASSSGGKFEITTSTGNITLSIR